MRPFNEEFEKLIINYMCHDIHFAHEYATKIETHVFKNKYTKVIFSIANKLFDQYSREISKDQIHTEINEYVLKNQITETISEHLFDELNDIFRINIDGKENYIKQNIKKVYERLNCEVGLQRAMDELTQSADAQKCYELIEKYRSYELGVNNGLKFEDFFTLREQWVHEADADNKIPFGYPTIDEALKGGMGKKELHILLGTTGSGKSSIAVNVGAYNIKRKKNVFHASFELTQDQILFKYACRLTGMYDYEISKPENKRIFEDKLLQFQEELPIYVASWPMYSDNTNSIKSWIVKKRAEDGVNPDLIIIDYDDLVLPKNKVGDLVKDGTALYGDFIELSRYFNCPVLVISQAGTEGIRQQTQSGHLNMIEISGARQKLKDASSVITINFNPNQPDEGYLHLEKARFGKDKIRAHVMRDLGRCFVSEVSLNVDDGIGI